MIVLDPAPVCPPEALPTISVVIPSYNQAAFLEQTLVSVIGQQYPKLEILVLDGGSTDGSVEIIRRYEKHFAFWRSEKDDGQAAAINEGMTRATGDVLCWLNSDDVMMPMALLDVGRRMVALGEGWIVQGGAIVMDMTQSCDRFWLADVNEASAEILAYRDPIVQPSVFWRREIWEQAGPLDPARYWTLDWEWFQRALRHAKVQYVARHYAMMRIHGACKTHVGEERRQREVLDLIALSAPGYWVWLYRQVFARRASIRQARRLLSPLRLQNTRALALFFPDLALHLRRLEDIFVPINALGIR